MKYERLDVEEPRVFIFARIALFRAKGPNETDVRIQPPLRWNRDALTSRTTAQRSPGTAQHSTAHNTIHTVAAALPDCCHGHLLTFAKPHASEAAPHRATAVCSTPYTRPITHEFRADPFSRPHVHAAHHTGGRDRGHRWV